ncbi:MAG: metallophosphoesterase [Clostridia bacterium]|nr:metallophosphoesterase [Clostridia bacterium]
MKRITTEYTFRTDRIDRPLRLAVASDLHSGSFDDLLEEFSRCDAVMIPGDLVDRHRKNNENALRFLETVPEIVPVFYSVGNHERKYRYREEYMRKAAGSKATLLDNESTDFHGVRIGGLSSTRTKVPDMEFLERFEQEDGYRLLLCHHPEMYRDYVAGRNIDLTLCGHAHGGQMQFFGRGLYAPGQGLFPKLTHGLHDGGKMLISRGMTNGAKPRVPRFNNPCELIILNLEREDGQDGTGRPEAADGLV